MKQERVQKSKSQLKRELVQREAARQASPDSQELKDDLDALLAEVDGVLEENAEEFVQGYVQKGGE